MSNAKQTIETGKAVLGIEFGSTRIKAVLVNETGEPIASGFSGVTDWRKLWKIIRFTNLELISVLPP